MNLVLAFLAGLFLTNGVPHLVKGITGQSHMTPFKRVSPAWLNIVWAFGNFVIGIWILKSSGITVDNLLSLDTFSISFLLGAFAIALMCALLWSNPNARLPWQKD